MIDYLYLESSFYQAWNAIGMVMRGLKPVHKDTDEFKKLYGDLAYALRRVDSIRVLNAPDAAIKRIALAYRLDQDFHSRFMSLMWDCKMLSEGAYSFFDPSTDKSSDKVNLKRGDRNLGRIQ